MLRLIAGIILGIWLLLVLFGKGGFIHLLLLFGAALVILELVSVYRRHVKIEID